jgi:hypothetical protein
MAIKKSADRNMFPPPPSLIKKMRMLPLRAKEIEHVYACIFRVHRHRHRHRHNDKRQRNVCMCVLFWLYMQLPDPLVCTHITIATWNGNISFSLLVCGCKF